MIQSKREPPDAIRNENNRPDGTLFAQSPSEAERLEKHDL
jgi:hypothetical protein